MGHSSAPKLRNDLIASHLFECTKVAFSEHVLTITLNRPDKRHAINKVMANELVYCLDLAKNHADIRVVLIRAEGPVFCAGADLFDLHSSTAPIAMRLPCVGELNDIPLKMRQLCKPVVVSVQGMAMAGALLMICNATQVIASDQAQFSAPEIKRGLWPHMVMAGLFRVMPQRQALDFIMRAQVLNATAARQAGLVTDVVAADTLNATTLALARELAQLAPTTLTLGLEAYYQQELMPFEQAIPYLKTMLDKTLLTDDAKEGIQAFKEKRPPHWSDPL